MVEIPRDEQAKYETQVGRMGAGCGLDGLKAPGLKGCLSSCWLKGLWLRGRAS